MAALLAPSLACDANPSADLSVQIVPASAPAVPAPAQAAGFTTQALNADFTSPAYANTATYIDNCGATASYRWYLTNRNGQPSDGLPCSQTIITTDGGLSALLITT